MHYLFIKYTSHKLLEDIVISMVFKNFCTKVSFIFFLMHLFERQTEGK